MAPFMMLERLLRQARRARPIGRARELHAAFTAFRERVRREGEGEGGRLVQLWRAAPSAAPALLLAIVLGLSAGGAFGEPLRPLTQPSAATLADPPRIVLRPDGALVLEVRLSQAVDFQPFHLRPFEGRPDRLVIDLPELRWRANGSMGPTPPGVQGVRFSRFDAGRSRIVVDLAAAPEILTAEVATDRPDGAARLAVTFRLTQSAAAPQNAARRAVAAPQDDRAEGDGAIATGSIAPPPGAAAQATSPEEAFFYGAPLTPRAPAQISAAAAPTAAALAPSAASPTPRVDAPRYAQPPQLAPNSAAPLTAPRPVASPRRRPDVVIIVIDPGHGGHDPGASGGGLREKDIVLRVAQALRARLHQPGRVHVYLTRTSDEYLTLQRRVEMAVRMQADIFISLHADSLPEHPEVDGASIYTLADDARDALVAGLVERENAGAPSPNEENDWVMARLAPSISRRVTRESTAMAGLFVDEAQRGGVGLIQTRPHRSGNFYVLRTLDMPAVLIELGFMTNSRDRARFGSDAWRDQAVDSISRAVQRWLERDYDLSAFNDR